MDLICTVQLSILNFHVVSRILTNLDVLLGQISRKNSIVSCYIVVQKLLEKRIARSNIVRLHDIVHVIVYMYLYVTCACNYMYDLM